MAKQVKNNNNFQQNDSIKKNLIAKSAKLEEFRKKLPIWPFSTTIQEALSTQKFSVLILSGSTGSGKSTQVPQFLAGSKWLQREKGRQACIAVTEPRRIAAISLAKRLASEMGLRLGRSATGNLGACGARETSVGWSVRFDQNVSTKPNVDTIVKYLTEGMLLRELLEDASLEQYGAIVVDEVHEFTTNVELILGFLKRILSKSVQRKHPLKVIIMSATSDIHQLQRYFDPCETYHVNYCHNSLDPEAQSLPCVTETSKANNPVSDQICLASKLFTSGDSSIGPEKDTNIKYKLHPSNSPPEYNVSTLVIPGRMYPVNIVYLSEPTLDFVNCTVEKIMLIHKTEPLPGDILAFLTGQDTVELALKLVIVEITRMDTALPKLFPLSLFAALPGEAQQKIFVTSAPGTRKVILSTNISETSLTVPGVRHVIDCGKVKVREFRNRLGLESLLVKPISKSSAIQRAGRAGREARGTCHRLYREEDFNKLDMTSKPEIQRSNFTPACLTLKVNKIDNILTFPFLHQPSRESIEQALLHLYQFGALHSVTGRITDVGILLSKFPLTPTLARCIIEAKKYNEICIKSIIDIVACLSVEMLFLNVNKEEMKDDVLENRRQFYRCEGDHLTLLAVVEAYQAEVGNEKDECTSGKNWCKKYLISYRAMRNVWEIRKQLRRVCIACGIVSSRGAFDTTPYHNMENSQEYSEQILRSLCAGFLMNTACLMPDGSYRTLMTSQNIAIHPSSVLFERKVEAILFTENVYTSRSYARGVSAIKVNWLEEIRLEGERGVMKSPTK